ncbi:MAG: hypothetical protein ACJASX_001475 [Limisphaerales bacterium]|jgi:hypothetical protein
MKILLLTFSCALFVTGCSTPTLYSWGNYESMVYGMYANPDKVTPEVQLEKLLEDLEKAEAKGKKMPPGFHAHLGFLYHKTGELTNARSSFETEKALFPESATLMDRFIANTGG